MKTIKQNKVKGSFLAVGTAFFQGMEGTLIPFLYLIPVLAAIEVHHAAAFSAGVLSMKETFSLVLAPFIFGFKATKNSFKKMKLAANRNFIYASVFGTSLGNICFAMAVVYATSTYGVILTSLYPLSSVFVSYFFLKEKPGNRKFWIGASVAITASALFIALPIIIQGTGKWNFERIMGVILGFVAAVFWSFEGVLMKRGFNNGSTLTQSEIIVVRNFYTWATTIFIFLPFSTVIEGHFYNSFSELGNGIFKDYRAIVIGIALAVNVVLLRLCHTGSIRHMKPKLVAFVDANNILVPPIAAFILQEIPLLHDIYAEQEMVWWAFLLIIPILIGVVLLLVFEEDPGKTKKEFDILLEHES